jgi:putative spermidine/putrescine transport system permease protein
MKAALSQELAASRRANARTALLLALPLVLFLGVFFIAPIAAMLTRSVSAPEVAALLPRSAQALSSWDGAALPGEDAFAALAADLKAMKTEDARRAGSRLNLERGGMGSLMARTHRQAEKLVPPYTESLASVNDDWATREVWVALKIGTETITAKNYVKALDGQYADDLRVVPDPDGVHVMLFLRTLWVAGLVTLLALLLGYPVAWLLATAPPALSGVMMIMVLLPFWTSLLVRTTAWIALLQNQGVVNDALVWMGLVADEARPQLIRNMNGTLIVMTHVLLPFMVLPLYSVMKGIPPAYVRAARSLGAGPLRTFLKVYWPLTLPGVSAGAVLVFVLACGYYVTPDLVGGQDGILIANRIDYHVTQAGADWGLAAALGGLLLAGVFAAYFAFTRLLGGGSLRFG